MRRQDDPVSILHTVAATLNQVPDVRDAMARILPRLTRALGLHTAWMFLFETGGTEVADVAYTGLPPALREHRARPLREGECHCQDTFRTGELTRAVNVVRCTRLQRATGDRGGLVFHASVPLLSKDRRLGILNVASPGRELFSADVLRVLSAVGQQVAVAIERSGLYRETSRRALLLGRLEQAAARVHGLYDEAEVAREVVRTLTDAFGFRSAVLYARVEQSWAVLAHAGPGRRPRPLPTSLVIPARALPTEPFHSGGSYPALVETIPGMDGAAAVMAASGPVLDAFFETLLASYAAHVGLALSNAALLVRQAELGAFSERERLARELHDAISQRLFSSTLDLAALAEEIPAAHPAHALVDSARTHTRAALAEMKDLVYELAPPRERTLGGALHALAPHGRVNVRIEADPPLGEAARHGLLRIAQEAVQNALRHAPGHPVEVRLREETAPCGPVLVLSVTDRGPGFDPASVRRGLGLTHMEERAAKLGTGLSVISAPGLGTEVAVRLPRPSASSGPPTP